MFIADQAMTTLDAASAPRNAFFLCSARNGVPVASDVSGMRLPSVSDAVRCGMLQPETKLLRLGSLDGRPCFCLESNSECLPPPDSGMTTKRVRFLLADASPALFEAVCRARTLLQWRKSHRFCGVCASPLCESGTDMALRCPSCGASYYPQIAPAVIVAITRRDGREVLLAHNRKFEPEVYSLIAGFVECGETAEQAAHREIAEETGVRVRNLRYWTSQPWPFPNSLMMAFFAEYESGEPVPDGVELSDCAWFDVARLPKLPGPGSVARKMIAHLAGSPC